MTELGVISEGMPESSRTNQKFVRESSNKGVDGQKNECRCDSIRFWLGKTQNTWMC